MIMYQTHCQRILDTVVRANFEEVSVFSVYIGTVCVVTWDAYTIQTF